MKVEDNVSQLQSFIENMLVGDAFICESRAYIKTNERDGSCVDLVSGNVRSLAHGTLVIPCPHASIKLYDPPAAA